MTSAKWCFQGFFLKSPWILTILVCIERSHRDFSICTILVFHILLEAAKIQKFESVSRKKHHMTSAKWCFQGLRPFLAAKGNFVILSFSKIKMTNHLLPLLTISAKSYLLILFLRKISSMCVMIGYEFNA